MLTTLQVTPPLLEVTRKLALTSSYGKFQLGAIVAQKKSIVSLGTNQKKTHPLQRRFSTRPHLQNWLHAEIHALSLSQQDLTGCDVYVARVFRDGSWANSRPCSGCQKALKHFGIRRMFYFQENEFCKEMI